MDDDWCTTNFQYCDLYHCVYVHVGKCSHIIHVILRFSCLIYRACLNAERKKVFDKIRPLCVQLTKEHTRINVQAINAALVNVDKNVLQDLQEYLLFPFRLILKQEKK